MPTLCWHKLPIVNPPLHSPPTGEQTIKIAKAQKWQLQTMYMLIEQGYTIRTLALMHYVYALPSLHPYIDTIIINRSIVSPIIILTIYWY